MGITNNCIRFLLNARDKNVHFTSTLTLGRQELYATTSYLKKVTKGYNLNLTSNLKYADGIFNLLGCKDLQSLDFSDYEGARLQHDLNEQIPEKWKNAFDLVFDGGTLEHVFNFPQAIKNCMEMVKPGGHFISITPANNQMGHGFYQFSPELLYRIFSKQNGYEVIAMVIYTTNKMGNFGAWYQVADPSDVKSRVTLTNSFPVSLMLLAKRTEDVQIFKTTPQQSDYVPIWSLKQQTQTSSPSSFKKIIRKLFPKNLRDKIYRIRKNYHKKHSFDIGSYHPDHFIRIKRF